MDNNLPCSSIEYCMFSNNNNISLLAQGRPSSIWVLLSTDIHIKIILKIWLQKKFFLVVKTYFCIG